MDYLQIKIGVILTLKLNWSRNSREIYSHELRLWEPAARHGPSGGAAEGL